MRKGFTLIELLVVIAIIAILAAILFPVFGKAREKARQTHCTNNQKQFATATLMYVQEHEETLPPATTFWGDIRIDKAALKCLTKPSKDNGYAYNAYRLDGKGIGQIRDANNRIVDADTVFVTADSDKDGNLAMSAADLAVKRHNGQFIASYLDGHVAMVPATSADWWFADGGTRYAVAGSTTTLSLPGGSLANWAITPATGVPLFSTNAATVTGANSVTIKDPGTTIPDETPFTVTATDPDNPGNVITWKFFVSGPITLHIPTAATESSAKSTTATAADTLKVTSAHAFLSTPLAEGQVMPTTWPTDSTGTYPDLWASDNTVTGQNPPIGTWVQYDMGATFTKKIVGFYLWNCTMWSGAAAVTQAKVQVSATGTDFATAPAVTFTPTSIDATRGLYTFDTPQTGRYVRLTVEATNSPTATTAGISKIVFLQK